MQHGLPRRLRYAFILQAAMATFAIVIGAFAVSNLLKQMLGERRMQSEADAYWDARAHDVDARLPWTSTVHGYFVSPASGSTGIPAKFAGLAPGVHDLQDDSHKVLVERRREGTVFLEMSFLLLDDIVRWTVLVSIVLALLSVYMVTWLTYRSATRLVEPVNWLATKVSRWDPANPDAATIAADRIPGAAGGEVHQLGSALRLLSERMVDFIQRERNFTRDASHELRTPLTVIRVATDMMLADPDMPPRAHRSLQRMQRSGRDMEAVIEAFLILARDNTTAPVTEEFEVREVIDEAIDKARELLAVKPVELVLKINASPRLRASPRVLSVMLDNLLDNACRFTEQGEVHVCVDAERIVVRDTGIGMSSEILQKAHELFYRGDQFSPVGKGMGLSIVRRLGERFEWPVTLESAPGEGTTATIGFNGHVLR